jgi:Flp pilus assembly protein TadB
MYMQRITEFLAELYEVNPTLVLLEAVMFGFVFVAILMIADYMHKHNVIQRRMAKLTSDLAEQEKLRNEEYDQIFEMEGATDKESRMRRLTKALEKSGIKRAYPEMSAELFILTVSAIRLIGGLGVGVITGSSLYGLGAAVLVLVVIYTYMTFMISRNEKAIEKDVMKFINLLENMSHTEGSIGEMLNRCVPYLNEPLKSSIERCYYDIKSTGDVEGALTRLADRTDYKQLASVFNYLRVCCSYDANYAEIIEENRDIIRMHLAFEKEKGAIKRSALADMGIIGIAGIVIIVIVSQMVDNVNTLIFHSLIGQIIMCGIFGTILYGIYIVIKQDKE